MVFSLVSGRQMKSNGSRLNETTKILTMDPKHKVISSNAAKSTNIKGCVCGPTNMRRLKSADDAKAAFITPKNGGLRGVRALGVIDFRL